MERDRNKTWPFVSDLEVRAFQYQLFPAKSCGILGPLFPSVVMAATELLVQPGLYIVYLFF